MSIATTADPAHMGGWLGRMAKESHTKNELWDLPQRMTDSFGTIEGRLAATLESYKYSTEPRSLIEWAQEQTGLNDPMTRYTRVELEQAFPGYARTRRENLQELVRLAKRQGRPDLLRTALRAARYPEGRREFERVLRG